MDVDGTPLVSRRRLWPQAELLKAYFMRATLEGGGSYRQAAEDLADALLKTYLAETPAATWRDCFDIEGGFTATSIPGSSLYHLWSGVAELISS